MWNAMDGEIISTKLRSKRVTEKNNLFISAKNPSPKRKREPAEPTPTQVAVEQHNEKNNDMNLRAGHLFTEMLH